MDSKVVEIYAAFEALDLLASKEKYWWPNSGTFEVVIGAILTQNTTWKSVEKSLNNLKGYLDLDRLVTLNEESLKEMIKPSGFYNQKAPRILQLAKNIKNEFRDFKTFQKEVSREWLLEQKGIGKESADAILCYACFREVMVVDAYTLRVLKHFGLHFDKYDACQLFLQEGVVKNKGWFLERNEGNLALCFACFHGMFVEYAKRMAKG